MLKVTVDSCFDLSYQHLSGLNDETKMTLLQNCHCFGQDLNKDSSEYQLKLCIYPMITRTLGIAGILTFFMRRRTDRLSRVDEFCGRSLRIAMFENKYCHLCSSENVFKVRSLCTRYFDVTALQVTCHLRL